MQKISLTAALLAATLSTAAMAADWVLAAENESGDQYYVDRESIRTMPSGYKRAWVRSYWSESSQTGATGYRSFEEFDCREGRSRRLQTTMLEGNDPVRIDNEMTSWRYEAPDTASEGVLNYVCFGKLD